MKFPLRVRRGAQCYRIEDAQGRCLVLHFESDAARAEALGRWTEQEARELATYTARMLTNARAEQLYLWNLTDPAASKRHRR